MRNGSFRTLIIELLSFNPTALAAFPGVVYTIPVSIHLMPVIFFLRSNSPNLLYDFLQHSILSLYIQVENSESLSSSEYESHPIKNSLKS